MHLSLVILNICQPEGYAVWCLAFYVLICNKISFMSLTNNNGVSVFILLLFILQYVFETYHYLHQGGYVIVIVCLCVSSFAQKLLNGFAWNFREGWQWANKQWLNFGCDPVTDPGKMCLGGGMHCPSASSYQMLLNCDWGVVSDKTKYTDSYRDVVVTVVRNCLALLNMLEWYLCYQAVHVGISQNMVCYMTVKVTVNMAEKYLHPTARLYWYLLARGLWDRSLLPTTLIMVVLWNRADHCIFILSFVLSFFFFFSSPNLSRHRLEVCHTSTHGVAIVRI